MAVYFFHGDEDYYIEQEVVKLKKQLDKNFLEMSFKTYNNPKFVDLVAILRTQPMMFGKMLIVINCLDYFSKTFEDKELKQISEALDDNNDNLDIIFVATLARNEGKKLDSRKKLFKLLSKYNAKDFPTIPSYKTADLEAFAKKIAKDVGLKFADGASLALVTQIGNDLRQIVVEIEKLKVYVYPSDVATVDIIRDICVSNEDLFAFSDFLMQKDYDKALLEYRKLLEKKYPLAIVATLQTLVRKWIIIKAKAKHLSGVEMLKLTGMSEYAVKINLQKLKNTSLKDLIKLKQNLTEAEYIIKSGLAFNVEGEIENVLFK
ncbi:MAG: DNA polymerase III subunit delta [Candidatus Gastranaerophilales bacterium]